MSKLLKTLLGVAAGAVMVGQASAADLAAAEPAVIAEVPPMFDVAFGVAGVSDYLFRGISLSKRDPAVQGYVELQTDWFYAGIWSSSVNLPNYAPYGLTDPSLEIDFYGGFRHTWDAFSLDVGGVYYMYPGERAPGPVRQIDYWEVYAKPSVAFGDFGSITGNVYWTSDYAGDSSNSLYVSIAPKINIPLSTIPDVSFYVSGEVGKQWKKTNFAGFNAPDYWTWNVGGGATWKAVTLDVRYTATDLNRNECFLFSGARRWCGDTVIGKISFDTSLNKLK